MSYQLMWSSDHLMIKFQNVADLIRLANWTFILVFAYEPVNAPKTNFEIWVKKKLGTFFQFRVTQYHSTFVWKLFVWNFVVIIDLFQLFYNWWLKFYNLLFEIKKFTVEKLTLKRTYFEIYFRNNYFWKTLLWVSIFECRHQLNLKKGNTLLILKLTSSGYFGKNEKWLNFVIAKISVQLWHFF